MEHTSKCNRRGFCNAAYRKCQIKEVICILYLVVRTRCFFCKPKLFLFGIPDLLHCNKAISVWQLCWTTSIILFQYLAHFNVFHCKTSSIWHLFCTSATLLFFLLSFVLYIVPSAAGYIHYLFILFMFTACQNPFYLAPLSFGGSGNEPCWKYAGNPMRLSWPRSEQSLHWH